MNEIQDDNQLLQPAPELRPERCGGCRYHCMVPVGTCGINPTPIERHHRMPACRFGLKVEEETDAPKPPAAIAVTTEEMRQGILVAHKNGEAWFKVKLQPSGDLVMVPWTASERGESNG